MRYRIAAKVIIVAVLLCILLGPCADAVVLFTPDTAGGTGTIYVAGNPDFYPVEYYDSDTKQYEGILPEILKHVSKKTGLNFTYIGTGKEDQRQCFAKNSQVEIVSGCTIDEDWIQDSGLTASSAFINIPLEDYEQEVCLIFTNIADKSLINTIEKAFDEITKQEIAGIAVYMMKSPDEYKLHWIIIAAAVLFLMISVIAVLAVKMCRYKKAASMDAELDVLTGIWNKAYFIEYFEKFISDQYRNLYCIVYIGFDIARVNRYYGEAAAEEQLCFAADELQLSTKYNEVAARVSGGGFAVARTCSSEQEIKVWTNQLLERLNKYVEKYGKDFHPEFRAGIYMLQSSDCDCEIALFNARQGYQQAIRENLSCAVAHREQLEKESEQLQLKKQILEALQNREFEIFLQFIVRANDGSIYGAEAVSRWNHPEKGLLFPSSYIELMESEGNIAELDFYLFEEVCRRLECWHKEDKNLSISCNFSRITIARESFVRQIKEIAERYVFDRSLLILEITEDAMESNKEIAFDNISKCKKLGFQIALDDTGNGYTSFSDLRDYPIDIVKIDRTILNAAITNRGAALLRGIIALVHSLQMKVVCEGAETIVQAELLRNVDCDYIQGYHFYHPLPVKEAERILKEI